MEFKTLAEAHPKSDREKAWNRESLKIDRFSFDETDHVYGWFDLQGELNGVCPGDFIVVGANSAGAGKTSFIMQLVDGMALNSVSGNVKTPIAIASELSAEQVWQRRMSCFCGFPVGAFRAGKQHYQADSYRKLIDAADEGLMGRTEREYVYYLEIQKLTSDVFDGLSKITQSDDDKRYPVLVVDSIQRFGDPKNEIESVYEIAKGLRKFANETGWIVIASTDTNKTTATNAAEKNINAEAAMSFRGNYQLVHMADVCIYLKEESDNGRRQIRSFIFKNRFGSPSKELENAPAYEFFGDRLRFNKVSRDRGGSVADGSGFSVSERE